MMMKIRSRSRKEEKRTGRKWDLPGCEREGREVEDVIRERREDLLIDSKISRTNSIPLIPKLIVHEGNLGFYKPLQLFDKKTLIEWVVWLELENPNKTKIKKIK